MKNRLRQRLGAGEKTHGLWVTLESPTVTEIAVTVGLDWVCVDTEHGHLGWREVLEHVRAVRDSETAVLVRVAEVRRDTVKRALDLGAHGVLLPLVRSRADVESGMRFGRYPPFGVRGVGGERAVHWGLGMQEYLKTANQETLIIPLIETQEALEDIDSILMVPGLEAIFFGPADLSASLGFLGSWEGPGVAEQILEVRSKAAERGIASGIVSVSIEDAIQRREQGFNLIGIGSDVGAMIRSLLEVQAKLGLSARSHCWF